MNPFPLLIVVVLIVILSVLVIRNSRRKDQLPQQRIIRRNPATAARPKVERSEEPAPAEAESREPDMLLESPTGWKPAERPDLEVETLWRLEHTIRDMPEVGRDQMVQVDFDLEPRELASVLASNPFFGAKILKTVNSAAFGLRYHIDSLQRAITFLGYNQVKNIIFQHRMESGFHSGADTGINMLAFWKHSNAVSVCADFILKEVLRRTERVGQITTAALMHDIGWVVFACFDRDRAEKLFGRLVDEKPENPMALEQEVFGFNHQLAGRMLAEEWKIPKPISDLIGVHHCGSFGLEARFRGETAFGACVVSRAEQLAAELGYQHPLAEPRFAGVDFSAVLGEKAGTISSSSVKLREEVERTMRFIEEFERSADEA
ncbi:MAG: HDOD domain-containing protein [Candidatus Glassbacteria bacterium]